MASISDLGVNIRVRYTRWAQFILSVASALHRVPLVGYPLMRLVYLACVFQMRALGPHSSTRWHWVRVPFPKTTKTESERA
jgi:hypothetical protein